MLKLESVAEFLYAVLGIKNNPLRLRLFTLIKLLPNRRSETVFISINKRLGGLPFGSFALLSLQLPLLVPILSTGLSYCFK